LHRAFAAHFHSIPLLMKSSLFVTLSSLFLLAWLALSYVTSLQPEPRLGRGSLPLSAQKSPDAEVPNQPEPAMLAKKQSRTSGY
jgi:hypothetical protein